MKKKVRIVRMIAALILALALAVFVVVCFAGCTELDGTAKDTVSTMKIAAKLQERQPTPTDIDYSLERYNLIKRAYWVNGQREKANTLPCEIEKPLGYVVLFTESGAVAGSFVVDGKVSSLNSFLTPDSEYYEKNGSRKGGYYPNEWLADVDGSYGKNDNGIFFFTTDGKYIEWTGIYIYSDIPFEVDAPVLKVGE